MRVLAVENNKLHRVTIICLYVRRNIRSPHLHLNRCLGFRGGVLKGTVFVAWGEVPDDACVVVGSTLMFVVVSKFQNIRASVCVSPWIVHIPHTRSVPVTCPAHAPLSSGRGRLLYCCGGGKDG